MDMRTLWIVGILLLPVVPGCSLSSSGEDTSRTSTATGTYVLLAVEHVTPPSNDVVTALGGAVMDGFGHSVLTYRNSKNQNFVDNDSFQIDNHYRVDADRSDPGAITPDGQFMFRVRKVANPSVWFFQREISGGATSLVSGSYHYVGYRHVNNGAGLLTGFGTATFTGTGGFSVNATLSNNTPEIRTGAVTITSPGVVTAIEGTETFTGATDGEGNVVGWVDLELTSGPYIRVDLFVRTGNGMHQATLNGTYNLGRFFQASLTEAPGSGFGTLTFDGKGNWSMDYTDQNSSRRQDGGTYVMASNGAATLTSPSGTLQAFLSPNVERRILIIADTDESNGEIGFFVATDR